MSTCCESSSVDRMNCSRSDETDTQTGRQSDRQTSFRKTDRQTDIRQTNIIQTDRPV